MNGSEGRGRAEPRRGRGGLGEPPPALEAGAAEPAPQYMRGEHSTQAQGGLIKAVQRGAGWGWMSGRWGDSQAISGVLGPTRRFFSPPEG